MSLPEQPQIDAKIERLLSLILPDETTITTQFPIAKLIVRLREHVALERSQPSRPDGYPTRSSGTDATGSIVGLDADVRLTGVEATVVAKQHWRDPHTRATEKAVSYLFDATLAVAALEQTLGKLDELGTIGQKKVWCENHLLYGVEKTRRGDGSVDCDACCTFRQQYGALPNRAIIEHADRLGWGRLAEAILRKQFPNYRARATR